MDTSEQDTVDPWQKRELTREGHTRSTTVTTVTESQPGGSVTTITRTVYTIKGPATQTRTSTRTTREILELTDTDGSSVRDTREGSRVETHETRQISAFGGLDTEGTHSVVETRETKDISDVGQLSMDDSNQSTAQTHKTTEIPDIHISSVTLDTREDPHAETSELTQVTDIDESNIEETGETSRVESREETREEITKEPSLESNKTLSGELITTYTTIIRETSSMEMPDDKPKPTVTESITTRQDVHESDHNVDKISIECDTAFEEVETSILEKS